MKKALLAGALTLASFLGTSDAEAQNRFNYNNHRINMNSSRMRNVDVETGVTLGGAFLANVPDMDGLAWGGYLQTPAVGKVYGEVAFYDAQREIEGQTQPYNTSPFYVSGSYGPGPVNNLYVQGATSSTFVALAKLGIDFGRIRVGAGYAMGSNTNEVRFYQGLNGPMVTAEKETGNFFQGFTGSLDAELDKDGRLTAGIQFVNLPALNGVDRSTAWGLRLGYEIFENKNN